MEDPENKALKKRRERLIMGKFQRGNKDFKQVVEIDEDLRNGVSCDRWVN